VTAARSKGNCWSVNSISQYQAAVYRLQNAAACRTAGCHPCLPGRPLPFTDESRLGRYDMTHGSSRQCLQAAVAAMQAQATLRHNTQVNEYSLLHGSRSVQLPERHKRWRKDVAKYTKDRKRRQRRVPGRVRRKRTATVMSSNGVLTLSAVKIARKPGQRKCATAHALSEPGSSNYTIPSQLALFKATTV